MHKIKYIYFLMAVFLATSFSASSGSEEFYDLKIEAGGCFYQISVNDKTILEGKSYQSVEKTIRINEHLSNEEEQTINVHMFRISREMSLKSTKAFVKVRLEKSSGDSVVLVKELKLPTFPYDQREVQPQTISGFIQFKINNTHKNQADAAVKKDSLTKK